MSGDVNVIVTDGFTGNVALKTAEGTANFITNELKEALTCSFLGKFLSILNIRNINKFRKKLDPRLYNGAILLGFRFCCSEEPWINRSYWFCHSLDLCVKIVSGI